MDAFRIFFLIMFAHCCMAEDIVGLYLPMKPIEGTAFGVPKSFEIIKSKQGSYSVVWIYVKSREYKKTKGSMKIETKFTYPAALIGHEISFYNVTERKQVWIIKSDDAGKKYIQNKEWSKTIETPKNKKAFAVTEGSKLYLQSQKKP